MNNIEAVFKEAEKSGEYLEFHRVTNKLSQRRDVHAFLMLDALVPGTETLIATARDADAYLRLEVSGLAKSAITEDQVRDLVRCGVVLEDNQLRMYFPF